MTPEALARLAAHSYIAYWREVQDDDDGNTQSVVRACRSTLRPTSRIRAPLRRALTRSGA